MIAALWRRLNPLRRDAGCHAGPEESSGDGLGKIAIVGNPNVGKSVVFNRLTGSRVAISNYPGTTVDVSRGKATFGGVPVEIVDTPGMYSFNPITEEERVARAILLTEQPEVVLHVVDARNLERMLPLTLQLIEAGLPVVLQLNMMDEAEAAGIEIDVERLGRELGVPVVATVAVTGLGMDAVKQLLVKSRLTGKTLPPRHSSDLEGAIVRVSGMLRADYGISRRSVGQLLLDADREVTERVRVSEGDGFNAIKSVVDEIRAGYGQPLNYILSMELRQTADRLLSGVVTVGEKTGRGFVDRLSRAMMNPVTGVPILLLVLYFGLYQFVGVLGAQTLVDFIEGTVFGQWINPWAANLADGIIPWQVVRDLFVGEYGVITLGLTYTFAIILPIVGTFFIVFAIIEDSGYLPRLAMLIDRVFKVIGLNGRAVIPMVLGFGCDTMATIVTRTQETKRERVITTLLLALAIPCSAQLGVIFAILSGNGAALFIWGGVIALVFLLVGYLASRVIPGEPASFYMEVPPLRLPRVSNVLMKTLTRLEWYFFEVMPIFIVASVVLWLGDMTGVLDMVVGWIEPLVEWIGLPSETSVAFLYGFFRRDFGAAGLYDLNSSGVLVGVPLVVAAVTLTLFVPCVAQFSIMWKERGKKTALAIGLFILPFAFVVGYLLNLLLTTLGVTV
ncbi:MAG: ferrous iron transport protein B [Dehalococcoidales bacterium]